MQTTSNDAELVNRSGTRDGERCFSDSELQHHSRGEEEGQRATPCSLAEAQRMQDGMKVFLGDPLQCKALFARGEKRLCAMPKADEQKQKYDPPLMFSDGCLVPHPQNGSICVQHRCLPSKGLTALLSRWADKLSHLYIWIAPLFISITNNPVAVASSSESDRNLRPFSRQCCVDDLRSAVASRDVAPHTVYWRRCTCCPPLTQREEGGVGRRQEEEPKRGREEVWGHPFCSYTFANCSFPTFHWFLFLATILHSHFYEMQRKRFY